jgi:TonB-linked SusC/RagA family outer membrane protein
MVALLCLLGALPLSAQLRTVSGVVLDSGGGPIAGALVISNGANRAAVSDASGSFSIEASPEETLSISFYGFKNATVAAGVANPTVTMEPETSALDEVVVVGYGIQRKATLTGAISSVGNKQITVTKNENVVNMLSGKIPGVRIVQSSAEPGSFNTKMDIRGFGDPLIVVDGLKRDKDYFSRMDATEIDNISVLKDGTAAIYGVEAANGVILVTTKRGTSTDGKFNISLSTNLGWQNFLYVPQQASALEYMLLTHEKTFYDFGASYPVRGVPPLYSSDDMLEYAFGHKQGTDWMAELFRNNVPQRQHNLSMDGGTDKFNYFFNLGFMDQQSAYKTGSLNYNRYNFRSNVDVKITDRLKASVQVGGYIDEKNRPEGQMWETYKFAWTFRPTVPAWVDGDHDYPAVGEFNGSDRKNPVATTDSRFAGFNQEKRVDFNGSMALTYDIPGVEGLNAKASYDYNYRTTDNTSYGRAYSLYQPDRTPVAQNPTPSIRRQTDPGYTEMMQLSLNYNNSFGDHNVSGTLVWEETQGRSNGFFASRPMLFDHPYLNMGESEGQQGGQSGLSEWARQALIGRFTYDYKGKYMAEFAFRNDASSAFASKGVWGFFPSASAGWRISEEAFVKDNVSFLTNFKLRASFGQMGNDANLKRAVAGYTVNTDGSVQWLYNGTPMIGVTTNPYENPDLTWYIAQTLNIGADFDLWNGMIYGSFDVFQRVQDGLYRRPDALVPVEVGAELPNMNMEKDKTFGWEATLGHRGKIGNKFMYYVDGQISATKNRWMEKVNTAGGNSFDRWKNQREASGRNKDMWFSDREEGGRFTSYDQIRNHFMPVGQGTLPGDYWYEDWNGDGVINDKDDHPVATRNLPVFNYGFTIGAQYAGFDLSANFQGAAGVYSMYSQVFSEVGAFQGAILDMYLDRWRMKDITDDPWNPSTEWISGKYPATGGTHSFTSGTTGIKNVSYLRLKTLELGYTFPNKWVSTMGVRNLRIYANGYNLLTFTENKDIDPERPGELGGVSNNNDATLQYGYPNNRVFNIGASIEF